MVPTIERRRASCSFFVWFCIIATTLVPPVILLTRPGSARAQAGSLQAQSDNAKIDLPSTTSIPYDVYPYRDSYRYIVVPNGSIPPSGFETIGFDDSGWNTGMGAFGLSRNYCPIQSTVSSSWPDNTQLVARKTFNLNDISQGVQVRFAVDNDLIGLYFNGQLIASNINHSDCPNLDDYLVNVPQSLLRNGNNTIAFHLHDYGFETFFDSRIVGGLPPQPSPTPSPGVAFNDTRIVDANPNISAAGRTPVILIHGLHGNRWPDCDGVWCDSMVDPYPHYFKNLILNLESSAEYQQAYKTYTFHWVSDRASAKDIGIALRDHLDRDPRFTDQNIIIVTHSTGGLIARWYMLETTYAGSTYAGRQSGERIQKLITLAAPHHGTYAANRAARLVRFGTPGPLNQKAILAASTFSLLDSGYWSNTCPDCAADVTHESRRSLLWDNFDGRFSSQQFPSEVGNTPQTSAYNNKITAYWGELDLTDPYWLSVTTGTGFPHAALAKLPGGVNDNEGSAIGAYFINSADRGDFPIGVPHPGNDGLIPVVSGRFDNAPGGPVHSIGCMGNNHARMRDGSGRLCDDHQILLNSIRNQILGVSAPNHGLLSTTLRAIFGRLPVFSNRRDGARRIDTPSTISQVEITNSGDQPLHVTYMTIGGADANQFSVAQAPALPLTVPAQSSVTIGIGFNPTSVGNKTAELSVENDSINSPVLIPLLGTGFPQECNLTLSPSSGFVSPEGGTSVINVGTIPCAMQVTASESWLHPVVVGEHIEFLSDPNPGSDQRDGVVFIALDGGPTLPFTVSQSPNAQPCGLNFSADHAVVSTAGGNSFLEVTTPTACTWSYQSDSSWLTLGTSGELTGPQHVTFTATSAMESRTAKISVTNGTTTSEFTIKQPGPTTIGGRVTSSEGRGVRDSAVTIQNVGGKAITVRTNRLGYFQSPMLTGGLVYTVKVLNRRYRFEEKAVQLLQPVNDMDFVAEP